MTKKPIAVLGIDLGKNSCSVARLDANGAVVLRRGMTRESVVAFASKLPACIVAVEACCGARTSWVRAVVLAPRGLGTRRAGNLGHGIRPHVFARVPDHPRRGDAWTPKHNLARRSVGGLPNHSAACSNSDAPTSTAGFRPLTAATWVRIRKGTPYHRR
jgi:hypothetical protein